MIRSSIGTIKPGPLAAAARVHPRLRLFLTALVLAPVIIAPDVAMACEQCFGAAVDSPTTQGIQIAMMMLLGTVSFVGSGILLFFANMKRRMMGLEPGSLFVDERGDLLDARDRPAPAPD